jgi:hypothetical protein
MEAVRTRPMHSIQPVRSGPPGPPGPPSPQAARRLAEAVNARFRAQVVRVGPGGGLRLAAVSSGFPALDAATGLGGFPRGRLTELIGRPTSGRETVAAHTVAAADGYSAWVDVPGLLDVGRLAAVGVDLERLFILRPACPRDALAIAAQLIASGSFGVVVLDTLSDLEPGGETARAVGWFVRTVTPALGRAGTAALVLSSPSRHHRPLAHAAALRIGLTQAGHLRRGGVLRGWRTLARVLKSPGLNGGESGLEVWLEG